MKLTKHQADGIRLSFIPISVAFFFGIVAYLIYQDWLLVAIVVTLSMVGLGGIVGTVWYSNKPDTDIPVQRKRRERIRNYVIGSIVMMSLCVIFTITTIVLFLANLVTIKLLPVAIITLFLCNIELFLSIAAVSKRLYIRGG